MAAVTALQARTACRAGTRWALGSNQSFGDQCRIAFRPPETRVPARNFLVPARKKMPLSFSFCHENRTPCSDCANLVAQFRTHVPPPNAGAQFRLGSGTHRPPAGPTCDKDRRAWGYYDCYTSCNCEASTARLSPLSRGAAAAGPLSCQRGHSARRGVSRPESGGRPAPKPAATRDGRRE